MPAGLFRAASGSGSRRTRAEIASQGRREGGWVQRAVAGGQSRPRRRFSDWIAG